MSSTLKGLSQTSESKLNTSKEKQANTGRSHSEKKNANGDQRQERKPLASPVTRTVLQVKRAGASYQSHQVSTYDPVPRGRTDEGGS